MVLASSAENVVRKPRLPRLTPMIGTCASAASRATPSSVPSPPITQHASTPRRNPRGSGVREVFRWVIPAAVAIAASSRARSCAPSFCAFTTKARRRIGFIGVETLLGALFEA